MFKMLPSSVCDSGVAVTMCVLCLCAGVDAKTVILATQTLVTKNVRL